jgi:tetratricopeptide (TPR) repeat protein
MKRHQHAQTSSIETLNTDAFATAAVRLARQRPIRSARLRQLAAKLKDGDAGLVEKELGEYLARYPDDPDALRLVAQIAMRQGRLGEAGLHLVDCLRHAPDFAAARFDYATILFRLNKFQDALNELDRLLILDGSNPLYRQMKANLLRIVGENDQSLALCEQLAAENPARAECWIAYGHALRIAGQRAKSVIAYRKAIACRPSSGLAYWGLADMKTIHLGQTDIDAIEEQLKRTDIPAGDRIALQFSLGKAYEDQCAYARSYEHYAKANAALRLQIDPSASDRLAARVAANKALFTPAFLESRRDAGCRVPDPIFILGRPRSGSTLIEQILSSHSAIEGTAELPYISALPGRLEESARGRTDYLKILETLDAATLRTLGEEYLESARVHRKLRRPFFIDKAPANFWHTGMIHLILPNAKIIDARRNPAACLLSMFKQYFNKPRPSLTELGRSYRDYVALMAHFESVMPGKIHRVIYEDMVADPEAEVRKLLDYLGLPFEEGCLRFYETERTVLTPSSEQVRKPISGDAIDYWRHYEPWLGPLLRSLGSAFTDYPSVPEELR